MSGFEEMNWGGTRVRLWTKGVPVDESARQQLMQVARVPIVHGPVMAMPDVHVGRGATVGSVIATRGGVIPSAVGVDIGCGMMAVRTSLKAGQLPDNLKAIRTAIEKTVPHGNAKTGGWQHQQVPPRVVARWTASGLDSGLDRLEAQHPAIRKANSISHLGTLGGGNHFVELCLDEVDQVWVMLHSGSRGIGNRIGSFFIEKARREAERSGIPGELARADLAYFIEGEEGGLFGAYMTAVEWAQEFAALNRELMMERVLMVLRKNLTRFKTDKHAVNCHHNYVAEEVHAGARLYVTRKGAVRAGVDELGIIPGSMGAKSFIVRGLGNADSLCSCSHGAGRIMSRSKAKQMISVAEHKGATNGVECRKDAGVIDESPAAYKDIDAVMAAQRDLVEIVHTLKQVVCVKG